MKKGYLENLRPSERRLVVGVALAFFVVLNFWFVFPQFSEWSAMQARMWEAQTKLADYNAEIAQLPGYEKLVRDLEKEGQVPQEEQAVQFSRAIQAQEVQSGVRILQTSKQTTRTNQFFIEQSQSIGVQSGEPELVDFLYNLGSGNSLIRVRDLSVRPDQPRQQLSSNIKLVASYQKKPAVKAGGLGGRSRTSASTTATPTARR